jgi:glyoxylase-like metal-dependent hydrolase (beta-lactamase superfamily II)
MAASGQPTGDENQHGDMMMSNSAANRSSVPALTRAIGLALVGTLYSVMSHAVSPVIAINDEAKTVDLKPQPVRGGIFVLEGSGGNVTVLSAANGKLMVDAGIAYSKASMMRALSDISSAPPRYLINTHYHWDHTDGNLWVHRLGATIIAQENTLKRLSVDTRVDDWEWTFPTSPVEARPTVIMKTSKTMRFHGTTLKLDYYGPCHTDSDISVYFLEPDVLVAGDTFWNGYYPFIDNENGGSIDGMIRAAKANVEKVTDHTIVVPGHGPLGRRNDLIAFRDMLVTIRENVSRLKAEGRSRDEVIALRPTADFDAKWGGFVLDGAFFTRIVYDGLN